jgi:hypothetical protein
LAKRVLTYLVVKNIVYVYTTVEKSFIAFAPSSNLGALAIIVNFSAFVYNISYLYHKARKCHFASASTVCGAEAPTEAHKWEHLQNIF